jgi:DNA-binding protein
MPSPTKPLALIYTMKMAVNTIILWLKKENQTELDPEFVKSIINLSTIDVAEIISGAGSDDYGKTVIISDAASSVSSLIVTGSSYTDATRTVTKTMHGLSVADAGKRISLWNGTSNAVIAEIVQVTDSANFIISKAFGEDISNTVSYAVFSANSSTNVDLSIYPISQITKIVDSISNEVIKVGDREFDNLYRFDEKQNKLYWFKHGQALFLYKGANVVNFGTLIMFYNSYPQRVMEDTDYLDIRDMYVPLVIAKAKNYCLEHLGIEPPESLQNLIDSKTASIRDNIMREKQIIEQKAVSKNG